MDTKLTFKQTSVYSFLRFKDIRSGGCKTPLYLLYYYYVKYVNSQNRPLVSPIEFGRRMSKYFVKGKSGNYVYYLTNFEVPDSKERNRIKRLYNSRWARMRNGKTKKR